MGVQVIPPSQNGSHMEDYKDNDEEYYEKIMRMKITRLGKN